MLNTDLKAGADLSKLPSVTAIIPCYNGELYLRDAIDSVLSQDLPALEVLVMDDGSTDSSAEIARSFDEPVRLLQQPNMGVSAARNNGILNATGELVVFLDADDLMLPGCLRRRVKLLEESGRSLLIGSYALLMPDGELISRKHHGTPFLEIGFWEMLGGDYCVGQSGMLVKREFFEKVGGFDPLMSACEDWDWQIRACSIDGAVFDPAPMVAYRQVASSASRSALRMARGIDMVMRKNRVFAPSHWTYFWISMRARTRVSGAMLFYRSLTEGSGSGLMRLLVRKPGLAPHFAMWLGRAGVNRVARLVGR